MNFSELKNNTLFRNYIGCIIWFCITIIISCIITLPIMIWREYYQYNKYLKPSNLEFEKDDIIRYSISIILAQILQILLIIIIF